MRPFPHPQRTTDWLTQYWNIVFGARLSPHDGWLRGPIGNEGIIGEEVIAQVGAVEDLLVERRAAGGLLENASLFGQAGGEIHPEIVRFYTCTSEYELEVRTRWEPFWGFFGRLVDTLFAQRLQQLCLPRTPSTGSQEISSELIKLRDRDGRPRHTVWLRAVTRTGQVMYSGFYYAAHDAFGAPAVKVVFPLPHGSATVVLGLTPLAGGGLRLASSGRSFGGPGFYFLVQDREGGTWVRHLRSFEEFIELHPEPAGVLQVRHTMRLWGRLCYTLDYSVRRKQGTPACAAVQTVDG